MPFEPFEPVSFEGQRILITEELGCHRARSYAHIARRPTVYAIARYARGDDCKAIEELGGIPVTADMANPDTFAAIREDVDYVITWSIRTFEQILEG